jgi:hypothetical protein
LVFDSETSTDVTQWLRIGFYQLRHGGNLHEEGIFYEPSALTSEEVTLVVEYARSRCLKLLTVEAFRSEIFLEYAYRRSGLVVGLNLPFDLSRIAADYGPARRSMRGGFSFRLTADVRDPRVRVKHLNSHEALIDFARPDGQHTPREMRRRGIKVSHNRGRFVDLKTVAAALLSGRFSLESLPENLSTPTRKQKTDQHGAELTPEYLDYARTDVQVTWECFAELSRRYSELGLETPIDRLLSEASIGKACLQQMGIKPLLGCDPSFHRQRFGPIMCAYYGGRAEVRIRRTVCEVLYCDFKSMYPTVNILMGLWAIVIAQGLTVEETTGETRALLESITLEDLHQPATWRKLCTLVR